MHVFTLDDPEMISVATNWVNDVIKTQCEDGYLGTYRRGGANIYDDYNAANVYAYRGLIAFFEATGRKDVLEAVHRTLLWFCDKWAGDRKTMYAGVTLVEGMALVYRYTGDKRLADFAEEYMEFLVDHNLFKKSYKTMLEENIEYLTDHAAGVAHSSRFPALVYTMTGNKEYLDASIKRIEDARKKIVHLTGGYSCAAEYSAPVSSTSEYEYCSFTYAAQSYACMSYITGEAKYGDYMENVFYNAAQGARKKDEKAIAYLTAPNQLFATDNSSTFAGDVQVYAPCYNVACCPVNAVLIVPEFVKSMMLDDDDGNIYVCAYGPCTLDYNGIVIEEKTLYPFRNKVTFEIKCDKSFKLSLKIPEWARGYTITVNEEKVKADITNGYAALDGDWKKGDIIDITFETKIEVIKIDDSDYCSKFPLAVKYGALVFSYHIPEEWHPIPGNPVTPLPEGWSFYNVFPHYEDSKAEDFHERLGHRREQFSWNIVVDENLSPDDITVEEIQPNGYIWENPIIKLHTHCYKALYLNALYQNRTFEPFGAFQKVTDELPLTLEPYGCTNLRLTYFHKTHTKK